MTFPEAVNLALRTLGVCAVILIVSAVAALFVGSCIRVGHGPDEER